METLAILLEAKFRKSFDKIGAPFDAPILLTEATKDEFGDYQVNGAMALAKTLKKNPRQLAQQIVDNVGVDDNIIAKLEIAGPGFINITLSDNYLSEYIENLSSENRYKALLPDTEIKTVVIDYSSPNLAKEMHVGHLRSTVIGDALANILSYMGNKVIRQNHVGDWGTQFGMLIAYTEELMQNSSKSGISKVDLLQSNLADLEYSYRQAKLRFDNDPDFANKARECVVRLQKISPARPKNEEEWLNLITKTSGTIEGYYYSFIYTSLNHCQQIYDKLDIKLTMNEFAPESMYNDKLSKVIEQLYNKNLIKDSEGAKCVFFVEGELSGGENTPFIVQKQDGGFLYATTDLAAVDFRTHILNGNRLLYVVDIRQSLHFKQVFTVAKKAGFAKLDTQLEHIAFGTMMNEDGKPFKTRDGGTVKLIDLIDEAINRAHILLDSRNSNYNSIDKDELVNKLAIASIKYADLSKSRISDYIFSFDKMLAFDGNTAPYLLYAYTRIKSLLRKALDEFQYNLNDTNKYKIIISHPIEHKLALNLAKFADNLVLTAKECYPHYLCQYLYNLASIFMQFYENCQILKEPNIDLIYSRLILSKKVAEIIQTGLSLLGIKTVEKM
ncbi:MAG: arginine--tRNA ligase [Neisseriaceae bacterium]